MTCACREIDLRKLNSLTKYPSIPTLHEMGERGRLGPLAVHFPEDEPVFVSEKIDGANARVVVLPGGHWLIGSREEFLAHETDLLWSPAERIVEALRPRVTALAANSGAEGLVVWYGEVYGAKVGAGAKNYTGGNGLGFRVFDIMFLPTEEMNDVLTRPVEDIAWWREGDGQQFEDVDSIKRLSERAECEHVPALPEARAHLCGTHEEALANLRALLPESLAALDDGAKKRPEGVVFRTYNREVIAKARFEDYERATKGPA